jgi:hypothetical protein
MQKGLLAAGLVGMAYFAKRTWSATGWLARLLNLCLSTGFGGFSAFLYSASRNSVDKLFLRDNGTQLEIETAVFGTKHQIDIGKILIKPDDPTAKMIAAT